MTADVQPILQVKDLYKRFGGLVAVDHVSLDIHPGEVVGLLGDNGAGKSTLIKMISGAYKPDGGQILLDGEAVSFATPLEARRRGIETIYQDLALCENLDASANIFLGRERMRHQLGIFRVLHRSYMLRESSQSSINWISAFLNCAILSANSLVVSARPSPLPVPCTGKPV